MSPANYFTHLRAIRSAEDRLSLLCEARSRFSRAMRDYIAQIDAEIARADAELTQAHTDRVSDGSAPCLTPFPPRRAKNS